MKTKYIIPNNTQLLKISSFNVNLNDDINRNDIIKLVAKYIYSEFSDIEIDIICIQGLNDEKLIKLLTTEIYYLSNINKIPIHIVPKIDINSNNSTDNSIELTWNISSSEALNNDMNCLTISKYPIITTSQITLNDSLDEKLIGSRKAIIANLNVNGYLISVYNITLSEDCLGTSSADFRKYEMDQLIKFINLNNTEMSKINLRYDMKLINKNVNIICGNFNIAEIKNTKINTEMTQLFKNIKALDTFRIYNTYKLNNDNGNTNINGQRDCYILLLLDINITGNVSAKELINFAYKKHGVTVVKSYRIKNIISNGYHPMETIFILNKEEKKQVNFS